MNAITCGFPCKTLKIWHWLGESTGCQVLSPITLHLWITLFWKYVCDVFALGYNEIFLYGVPKSNCGRREGSDCMKLLHPLPDHTPPVGHFQIFDIDRHCYVTFYISSQLWFFALIMKPTHGPNSDRTWIVAKQMTSKENVLTMPTNVETTNIETINTFTSH